MNLALAATVPVASPRALSCVYHGRIGAPERAATDVAHPDTNKALLDAALAGDAGAIRSLVRALTPVVQARVGRALLRRRALVNGDLRERTSDLVQDVFVELLRDGGRALRAWDPARGLSLPNWVGLIAEQRAAAALRGRRAAMGFDVSMEDAPDAQAPPGDDPEASLLARDRLQHVLDVLRAELSPLGMSLFQALVVEEEAIASVASRTGMSISAVQAWSSRLKRRIAAILDELSVDVAPEGAS